MNIDISKYLKNKDLKISKEDFDLEKLEKDITSSARKNYHTQDEYDNGIKGARSEATTKYSELETKYNTLQKTYDTNVETLGKTNGELSQVRLQKTMLGKGFKEDNFEEVAKLRTSLYGDVKDDSEAINSIAERYKATYFPEGEGDKTPPAPNEPGVKGGNNSINRGGKDDIKITRDTPLSDMRLKK